MATTSTMDAALNYIQETLSARPGLAGVQVVSGPMVQGQVAPESVQLWHVQNTLDWNSLGNLRRQEEYDILGALYAERPGAGESAIRDARARASALLAELEGFIVGDHKLGGLVTSARLRETGLIQDVSGTGNRSCSIPFTISVKATLTRS